MKIVFPSLQGNQQQQVQSQIINQQPQIINQQSQIINQQSQVTQGTQVTQSNQNNRSPQIVIEEEIEEDLGPTAVIEETIIEDARVPEQVAQEIIIKDGTITHIGAAPLDGFFQPDHIGRSSTHESS